MLKRSLCLSVLFVVFVSMCSSAFADYYSWRSAILMYCSVCMQDRAFSSHTTQEVIHSISYKDISNHAISVSRTYVCNGCLVRGYAPETYPEYQVVLEAHILSTDIDAGHVEGTRYHNRTRTCTRCTSFTYTYTCFGPPCNVYTYKLPNLAAE